MIHEHTMALAAASAKEGSELNGLCAFLHIEEFDGLGSRFRCTATQVLSLSLLLILIVSLLLLLSLALKERAEK